MAAKVLISGSGETVVCFHDEMGRVWTPLNDRLAERRTVYAPYHPGWDDLGDLEQMDTIWELLLYYRDIIEELRLERPALVGSSFGAMVAAEFAATFPELVSRIVLIAPIGLWRDDEPVADLWGLPQPTLNALLWADPECQAAVDDSAGAGSPAVALARYLASTSAAHFVWPVPERGLVRRLRRVKAPTLLIWGKKDGVVPVSYAGDFAAHLGTSTTVLVDGAAHNVHLEHPEVVAAAIQDFLS